MGLATAIGLGVAGVGAAISSRSNRSAANTAAQTSQQNNTQNTALAREIYGQNRQVLSPFTQRGNVAGDQINALLGLAPAQQPQMQPNALSQFNGQPQAPTPFGGAGMPYGVGDYAGFTQGRTFPTGDPRDFTGGVPANAFAGMQGSAQPSIVQPTSEADMMASGQTPQQDAFDAFRNSTGFQFRRDEGLDAVNSAYAGIGGLQSGAAMRGIAEYGQNFASNEFGNYMNALSNQQAVGAGTASSLAGVGQNFAGTVINSNNMNAANQMNAQLSRGANNPLRHFARALGGGLCQEGPGQGRTLIGGSHKAVRHRQALLGHESSGARD